jgi:hypothetical protein
LARFFGLARFFSIFSVSVSVRFGFFSFLLIKPKPNQTGCFFLNFNRFNRFFFRFGFFSYFFSSLIGLISFSVFFSSLLIYRMRVVCTSVNYFHTWQLYTTLKTQDCCLGNKRFGELINLNDKFY